MLLLLLASCKDEGVERHKQALEKYSDCVSRGEAPNGPCFAEVLTLLKTVPSSSVARPKADALRDALLNAQQPKLRTPLAIQGGAHLPSDVIAVLKQCQRLAEELGTSAEADRPAKMRELDACRARAEKLDTAHVHGEEDVGSH